MLVEQCRAYFVRSIELERKVASWVASGFRSRRAGPCGNDLDALRDRLETAKSRVAHNERLVTGWRAVIEAQQGADRDLAVARDLLSTFENGLEEAMNSKEAAQSALDQRVVAIFEGSSTAKRSGATRLARQSPKAKPQRLLSPLLLLDGARPAGPNASSTTHRTPRRRVSC
jgi:hypothetical protein